MTCLIRLIICLTLGALLVGSPDAAAQGVALQSGDFQNNIPTFVYDPADGNITVYGDGLKLTTLEILSQQSLFRPESAHAGVLSSPFDVFTSSKFFHLHTSGFESLEIGPVLPPGLSFDELRNDLVFSGSIHPAGLLPGIDALVPEPAGWLLAVAALPLLTRWRRAAKVTALRTP
jgi:hypothetical protein